MSKKETLYMPLTLFILMMLFTLLNEYVIKENKYAGNLENTLCSPIFFLTREDIFNRIPYPSSKDFTNSLEDNLQTIVADGDILVTFCSHTFTYRHGHAALVIDAQKGITLEATQLGSHSSYQNLEDWNRYTSFSVLRLSDDTWEILCQYHQKSRAELTKELISFAQNNMLHIPYVLSVGIFFKKYTLPDTSYGTNCSHLVWQCYRFLGVDLDADRGLLVTPMDLYQSPFLVTIFSRPVSAF